MEDQQKVQDSKIRSIYGTGKKMLQENPEH